MITTLRRLRWLLLAGCVSGLISAPAAGAGHDGTNVFHLGVTNIFGAARLVGSAPAAPIGYFEQQSATGGVVALKGTHSGSGIGFGVNGVTLNATFGSAGVWGLVSNEVGSGGSGVRGQHDGFGPGVSGSSEGGFGVSGQTNSTGADAAGVAGRINSNAANAAGVRGRNNHAMCCGMGVAGFHDGQGIGIYGESLQGFAVSGFSPNNWSGYFQGNVRVVGNLQKNSGSFTIDHPLDPANKYLSHSFVESPDMKNVYDGIVTTNAKGFAVVRLPRYFSVLNRDFRYQLTVVGHTIAEAQVWDRIAGNRFTIRTTKPRVEVSWQVTGIRTDRWANAHRIVVEEAKKPSERGKYLNPELYGKKPTQSVVVLPGMDGVSPRVPEPKLEAR